MGNVSVFCRGNIRGNSRGVEGKLRGNPSTFPGAHVRNPFGFVWGISTLAEREMGKCFRGLEGNIKGEF